MPEKKIWFAVGIPEGPRSSIWMLAGQRKDAYLIPLEVKTTAKISLHLETGEFSWGYTYEYFRENKPEIAKRAAEHGVKIEGRDFERWEEPKKFKGSITLPCRIYVANEALQTDPALPTSKPITWVAPRSDRAVGFVFVIAKLGGEPPLEHPDVEVLGRMEFPFLGKSISLLAHHIKATIVSEAANRSIIEFTKEFPDFKFPPKHRLFAQGMVEPDTGSRNLIEIPTYSIGWQAV